ncbi:MAG: alanine dehydrogenase [Pseudomonadota bacterium]
MRIGCPREIKPDEHRVGLTPEAVAALTADGHRVLIESGAGLGVGATDEDYRAAGAEIAADAATLFAAADLVVKVKEPLAEERSLLREGQVLFAYLHLAADRAQTDDLLASGAVAIAYETVTEPAGGLPLLRPMSVVAGRLAAQAGAMALQKERGGRGVLLGGAPGAAPGEVLVIGGGVVGLNAAQMALGLGARATLLDRNPAALERARAALRGRAVAEGSFTAAPVGPSGGVVEAAADADLIIGAVLVPGAKAPKLLSREMLSQLRPGAALVDVAIDQGGCFETSRPTTHRDPTYLVDGIVHYCVANMPGAVARTATYALVDATLPHVKALAALGWREALRRDAHLAAGLNVSAGRVICPPVAEAFGLEAAPLSAALA